MGFEPGVCHSNPVCVEMSVCRSKCVPFVLWKPAEGGLLIVVKCAPCPAIILKFAGHGRHVMLFVNSRYVLLTYAQCGNLDEWVVNDHLAALNAECIIAREVHPTTGGVHLHVFVDFGRKFRSRSPQVFDVDGRHPNVSPSRGTPEKGYDYAIKDGDVIAGGLGRPKPRGGMHVGAENVFNISHLCESPSEFLELLDEMDRRNLCDKFTSRRAYADWRFAVEPERYTTPATAVFSSGATDGRDEWLSQSGIGRRDLVLGECLASVSPLCCLPVAKAPSRIAKLGLDLQGS